jgi:signal transduction histidine kinase
MSVFARVRRSLRWRLLAATLVGAGMAVALAGWLLAGMFRDHVTRQAANVLTAQLDQVTARLEFGAAGAVSLDPAGLSDPRWLRPYSGLYWQVDGLAPSGVRRGALRSRSLWDAELQAPADVVADGSVHTHEVAGPGASRLLLVERTVRPEGDGAPTLWRVLVAGDLRETEAAVAQFNGVLALSLAVLLLLLLAAAIAQVTVGLLPLHALQRALGAVRAGQAQRLQGQFPAEVQPLVDQFNGVLDLNAAVVTRARTQAGNLAHALKTPLAALRQAAGTARQRPDTMAGLPSLIEEQVDLARRQVDWHLSRARVAAAQGLPGVRTEVAPVLAGLMRVMERVHGARGLHLVCGDVSHGLVFAGEAQDLHEIVGNVLDNACKWARSLVRLQAVRLEEQDGRWLCITVEDDGPGISQAQRTQALTRGQRLDETVPGSGLGLAIVSELIDLYRGRMTLDDRDGGGLLVRMLLPTPA